MRVPRTEEVLVARFWARVSKGGPDECWPWKAYCHPKGYGLYRGYRPSRHSWKAHRLAYNLTKGPIPEGMFVCHSCDNPPCCNPAHLWIGTNADNTADKVAKGRQSRGEENGNAKLTERQVANIKRRLLNGCEAHSLAAENGVGYHCINDIRRGKTWRHVAPAIPTPDTSGKES